jgi:GT2 family glycosyltransferase
VIENGPRAKSAVVIVTFEETPDSDLLATLPGKVDHLVVVDNSETSESQTRVRERCGALTIPCSLIQTGENLGVAKAVNAGIRRARALGCELVFLLDGDAKVEPGYFQSQRNLLETLERQSNLAVGAVVPIVTDADPSSDPPSVSRDWTVVQSIITSGTLARISTIDAVGGFNESLFVEGVDFDFAARLRASGRSLVRINRVLVRQPFGAPVRPAGWLDRSMERLYSGFYYLQILAGRSNSFHTRLSRYSLQRRREYVRSFRVSNGAIFTDGRTWGLSQFIATFFSLAVDSIVNRDRSYLRLLLGGSGDPRSV